MNISWNHTIFIVYECCGSILPLVQFGMLKNEYKTKGKHQNCTCVIEPQHAHDISNLNCYFHYIYTIMIMPSMMFHTYLTTLICVCTFNVWLHFREC